MKSERGSVLLIVLFMLVILSVLGMSVLSASIGGGIRSETREDDVQSLHLAEKALNEAMAQIKNTLDDVPYDTVENFEAKINSLLGEIENPFESGLSDNVDIAYKVEDESTSADDYSYRFKISATATVNGVSRTLVQYITINAFPDFLSYAIGSKGPVTLNGSPYIIGNVYVGEELNIYNRAEYIYNDDPKRKMTVYPNITGQIFLAKEDLIHGYQCFNEISECNVEPNLNNVGINTAKLVQVNPDKFIEVNVGQAFIDKIHEAADTYVTNITYDDLGSSSLKDKIALLPTTIPAKFATNTSGIFNAPQETSIVYNGNLFIDGTQLIDRYSIPSDPESIIYRELKFTGKNERRTWLIVTGNLEINNFTNTPIHIDANILVMGNVYISGIVNFDSTIIVLNEGTPDLGRADVQLADASIGGIEGKSLVLLAREMIKVTRVNEFEPIDVYDNSKPDVLKAFFYTEGTAVLYGVGSSFRIHGGFFARESLVINALRGNTTDNASYTDISVPFQDQSRPDLSRFVVEYNKDVFKQDNGLPRIKTITVKIEPRQLERK